MKLFSFLLVLFLSFSVSAQLKFNNPNKVIGKNDLIAVDATASNIPVQFASLVDAFGIMNMGCTATHIGNGFVLTAGHCFWAPRLLTKDITCDEVTINWGVREGKEAYLQSKCEMVLFAQTNKLIGSDFAILKVSPSPSVSIPVELERKALVGDSVTIFSHPEELPLQWSKICEIEASTNLIFAKETLQHKCDTNPGSSGATILDATMGKVVGVYGGGRLTTATEGLNYGTFLTNTKIIESLKSIGF
jgi:V8-like Glu-specific endopeptidase